MSPTTGWLTEVSPSIRAGEFGRRASCARRRLSRSSARPRGGTGLRLSGPHVDRAAVPPKRRERKSRSAGSGCSRFAGELPPRFLDGARRLLLLGAGGDRQQVASITSNAAQALWTGIATADHAYRVAERMMKPDMFSGWGIRTLSADHPLFDPLAYQQGSVWPFDNALIVSGLRRYGEGQGGASNCRRDPGRGGRFPPEATARVHRRNTTSTRRRTHPYPRADPLQAWSAAAYPS